VLLSNPAIRRDEVTVIRASLQEFLRSPFYASVNCGNDLTAIRADPFGMNKVAIRNHGKGSGLRFKNATWAEALPPIARS